MTSKSLKPARSSEGGYTLLFAVLTATLVLGVAVFIVDLSRKQGELSVSARNSIYSFYAADSGIECFVSDSNWVNAGGYASTSDIVSTLRCGSGTVALSYINPPVIYPANIIANGTGQNIIRQKQGYVSLAFDTGQVSSSACALITITTGAHPTTGQPMTIIDSRGYNICAAGPVPSTTNRNTVERALRLIQSGVW